MQDGTLLLGLAGVFVRVATERGLAVRLAQVVCGRVLCAAEGDIENVERLGLGRGEEGEKGVGFLGHGCRGGCQWDGICGERTEDC